MLFRIESEIPLTVQIRLKVEINCFEHFNVLSLTKFPFKVENSWFTGEAEITTYHFEELLGTKLRALYQRKKGRDLFGLYIACSVGRWLLRKSCNVIRNTCGSCVEMVDGGVTSEEGRN